MYHIIAAIGLGHELGKNNDLIWRNKADLQNFKKLTTGKPMVLGYNTLISLGRLLPNRQHLVLIDNTDRLEGDNLSHLIDHDQVVFFTSIEDLDKFVVEQAYEEVMVIGGANVYQQFIKKATKMTISHILQSDPEADVFFPSADEWACWYITDRYVLDEDFKMETVVYELPLEGE